MKNIIHLHGFASSPASSKAQFFKQQLAQHDIMLRIPDLNVPGFEQLTLTAMIERAMQEIDACPPGDVALIGSSMGGGAALHLMNQRKSAAANRVKKLVLLAPAIDFMENRQRQLGDEGLRQWRESGWLTVEHYGYKEKRRVHYGLLEDLQQYNGYDVKIDIPVLLIHGRQDESVDVQQSIRFAAARPNVQLELIDADHSLLGVLPDLWTKIAQFLDLEKTS